MPTSVPVCPRQRGSDARAIRGRGGAALLAVCLALAGCGGSDPGPGFPYGRWAPVEGDPEAVTVIDFRADGRILAGQGEPGLDPGAVTIAEGDVLATFTADERILAFEFPTTCSGEPGPETATYTWQRSDDQMTLGLDRDPCPERVADLDGAVLTWVGESAPGDAATPRAVGEPLSGSVPWWNDAVFYEVFVRSFADSDGDGNGDLRGLIDRLDHLNDGDPGTTEDLGVTALWLMPVAQSPSYHGYDTTDYYTVEEDYGTNTDFRDLVAAAHARGIRIIVDLMLNHTSVEHPWFLESAGSPNAPKRDWYVWADRDPGTTSPWGGGPLWHERDGAYYYGLFWEGMPDLNFRTPAVTEQMYDVARFWVEDMGVDGFRLDAVRHLIESGGEYAGTPETHEWLVGWDDHIDTLDPQALTVGEVWDETSVVAPYVRNDEVDLAFSFGLAEAILGSVRSQQPGAFATALAQTLAEFPPGQFAPFLTNHDQDRVMTQLGGDEAGAALAASALLTLPGVPFVYYGEEIGMTGQKPDELIRTPMQWTGEEGAGFTTGTPWQPVNDDSATRNVAGQAGDPRSLLTRYRALVGLRAAHPVLRHGGLITLDSSCPQVVAFLRTPAPGGDDESALVVLNFANAEAASCAFSGNAGTVAAGRYRAVDLLAAGSEPDATAPQLVVEQDGIAGYTPLDTLAPRQAAVMLLSPS